MRYLLFFAMIAFAANAACAQAEPDTIVSLNDADSVTIVSTKNSISVKVDGTRCGESYNYDYKVTVDTVSSSDWEINLPFTKSQGATRSRRVLSLDLFDGFYVGATLPVDDIDGMRAGWEIGINNVAAIYYRPWRGGPVISLGIGLGYQSVNVGGGWCLGYDSRSQALNIIPKDVDMEKASSRLHLCRMHVPLLLTQHFSSDFAVQLGGVLNLNAYMKATTKTKADGVTRKNSFNPLHQRFATVDLFAGIQFYDGIGVYVRYSPMQAFDKGYGPCYDTVSFGLSFGF